METALAAGLHPASDFFYADEERWEPLHDIYEHFLKPDWSPDLLLSTNYIGRPWFARPAILKRAGVTARVLIDHGQYECVLRCTEHARGIEHLPKVLGKANRGAGDNADRERGALRRAAGRRGVTIDLLDGCVKDTYRLRRTLRSTALVSIIIPTCGADGRVRTCIESLRAKTAYSNFEVICIDNIPPGPSELRRWVQCPIKPTETTRADWRRSCAPAGIAWCM